MAKRSTMHDVAKLADVSVATVSAVVNQNKYVSPELTQRVRQAIDRLGYRPNLLARSLKMRETHTIGLVLTNITSSIWPPLVRTAQTVAQEAGFDTFLVTTDEDVSREKTSLQNLLSNRVDGILIAPAPSENQNHIQRASQSVPIIVIERKVRDMECVVTDNEQISYHAVSHLIMRGCQRIGLVTIPILGTNIAERIAGYRRALDENGLYDPSLIREADFVGQKAFDLGLDLLLGADLDAIFTTSQSTAIGVLRATQHLGRRIPDDLALVAYDDVPWMQVVNSPLSTVRQPVEEMAELATSLLLERIAGREPRVTTHVVASTLIVRQSCGCHKRAPAA